MLLAKNKSWVLCTPSKTGSSSLIATLVDKLKVADHYRPGEDSNRHGTVYHGKAERLLIVRHPLERWSSIYWYAQKKEGRFLHKYSYDVNEYFEAWMEARRKNMFHSFTMFFEDYLIHFTPKKIFKLEDGLEKIMHYLKLPTDDVSEANVNKLNVGWKETSKLLTKFNRERLEDMVKADIKLLKY